MHVAWGGGLSGPPQPGSDLCFMWAELPRARPGLQAACPWLYQKEPHHGSWGQPGPLSVCPGLSSPLWKSPLRPQPSAPSQHGAGGAARRRPPSVCLRRGSSVTCQQLKPGSALTAASADHQHKCLQGDLALYSVLEPCCEHHCRECVVLTTN